jgi:hypothetical protein
MNRITPFIKRLRASGGTIFTFNSATEDIGLNINERNNVVKISHFALLNIPSIDEPANIVENKFNVRAIAGAWNNEQGSSSIKDGNVLIAESFQNYALNLESNILNQNSYNASLSKTVSERVFWKWLKETGAIRWTIDTSVQGVQYWSEISDNDGSLGYNSVVKYIGQVSAGNVRSDSFGTYNETYILVPTSHGQVTPYFKIVEDDNYKHDMEIGNLGVKILGRENYTLPHPDILEFKAYYDFVDSSILNGTYATSYDNSTGSYVPGWWYSAENKIPSSTDNAYLTDSLSYLTTGIYHTDLKYKYGSDEIKFRRSKLDCMSLIFNINELQNIYADSTLTYDSMAINYAINDNFEFNAVLIYYTVYNSTMDEVLSINLLGILFLDGPSGNTSNIGLGGIIIPSLEKMQSTVTGFGTSYSLRVNIKTDNMVDDTQAMIIDYATSDQLYAEDWSTVFASLGTAVNILAQNNSTLNYISNQYGILNNTQTQIINEVNGLKNNVYDIIRDIQGTANTLAMFANGDDPLIDSSIFMKFGNIGINNNNPQYPLHITGTTKTDNIIIENNIKDTSGNILLGYGSPLQIGSSTNYRNVAIYTGNVTPDIYLDASGCIDFNIDLSINKNLSIDGSAVFNGPIIFNGPLSSPNFNFDSSYLRVPEQLGAGLSWDGIYLNVIPGSDVSAFGQSGWIQYNYNAVMYGDSSLYWNIPNKFLGLGTKDPSGRLHVMGSIYAQLDNASSTYLVYYNNLTGKLTYDTNSTSKTYVDGSLANRDTSINNLRVYVDGSLAVKTNFTYSIKQDASISLKTSFTYVDGSLANKDTSINYLYNNKLNLDSSILLLDVSTTLSAAHNGLIIEASGNLTITFPNSMVKGMNVDIVNISTGTITLQASTLLLTDSSKNKIATKYTGASVYHRGSNIWLAVGKLTA